jgi:hypothetical protein
MESEIQTHHVHTPQSEHMADKSLRFQPQKNFHDEGQHYGNTPNIACSHKKNFQAWALREGEGCRSGVPPMEPSMFPSIQPEKGLLILRRIIDFT